MPTLSGGVPDPLLGGRCSPRQLKGAFFSCRRDNTISLLSRGDTNTFTLGIISTGAHESHSSILIKIKQMMLLVIAPIKRPLWCGGFASGERSQPCGPPDGARAGSCCFPLSRWLRNPSKWWGSRRPEGKAMSPGCSTVLVETLGTTVLRTAPYLSRTKPVTSPVKHPWRR